MVLKRTQQILGKVAASLGIFQGFLGTTLSLTVIILHYKPNALKFAVGDSFREDVELTLYFLFVREKSGVTQEAVLAPNIFVIVMWWYLLLNLFWIAISVSQYVAIIYEKKNQALHMALWGMYVLLMCIFDVVIVGLLTDNLGQCNKTNTICIVAVGITMALAARGWTLWFVNLAFSYILINIAKNQTKDMPWFERTIKIPRARIHPENATSVQTKPTTFNTFSVFEDTSSSPTFMHELQTRDNPVYGDSGSRPKSFSNQESKFTY